MWVSRIVFTTFVVFIFTLPVNGDGPTCSQSGVGPADMMMSNGNMNPRYMWHSDGGSVSIPIVLDHEYSTHERGVIFGGLAEMASKTCVKFYVYKHPEEVPDGDYVYITKSRGKGCWSYVGKQGGKQDLSLPRGCINHRTVMHEMMHALGFSHEHVRSDRDKYVHILWENIQRGRERNFQRKQDSKSDAFGPYDYDSIMHYEKNAFSANKHDTIQPLRAFVQIGVNKRMSHWDAYKINRAYKCNKGGVGGHGLSGFGKFGFGHSEHSPAISLSPGKSYHHNPFIPNHPDPDNGVEDSESEVDYFPPLKPYYDDYYN